MHFTGFKLAHLSIMQSTNKIAKRKREWRDRVRNIRSTYTCDLISYREGLQFCRDSSEQKCTNETVYGDNMSIGSSSCPDKSRKSFFVFRFFFD